MAWGAFLLTLVGVVVLIYLRQHRVTLPADRTGTPTLASPDTTRLVRPIIHATITAGPSEDARAWTVRSNAVVTAKNEKRLGVSVAHLLDLPPAEAWSALTERARNGDFAAATAALSLANECKYLPQQVASMRREGSGFLDHATSGLPNGWESFLRDINAERNEQLEARVRSCADVGGVWDFALMVLDRFVGPNDLDTQLAVADEEHDDDTAIADLRQLSDETDDARVRWTLGKRLIQSRDTAAQLEGRALLEELAADDPDVVGFLANCFKNGCGFFRGDPDVADAWIEQAAGLGEWWALRSRIADLRKAGQTVDAWAWMLYRLDLAEAGCFETNLPELILIAESAQDVFQFEPTLNAAQQAQGRSTASVISSRWQTKAAARLSC